MSNTKWAKTLKTEKLICKLRLAFPLKKLKQTIYGVLFYEMLCCNRTKPSEKFSFCFIIPQKISPKVLGIIRILFGKFYHFFKNIEWWTLTLTHWCAPGVILVGRLHLRRLATVPSALYLWIMALTRFNKMWWFSYLSLKLNCGTQFLTHGTLFY